VVATLRGDFQIGQHNIELARRLLQEWEVSVMAADVGGRSGRKVALSMPSCKTRAERIVSAS
jgi:chemotaxis receptor (MCP) glutamine deamidase CheD